MKNKIKINYLAICAALMLSVSVSAATLPYKNKKLPVATRVADLMSRMTLDEKVAQMCQYVGPNHIRETQLKYKGKKVEKADDANGFYANLTINDLLKLTEDGMVGSYLHVLTAQEANELQTLAMKSRLQIPILIGIDAIHGNALVSGTTVYPSPITQASSFDTDLVKKVSRETALEMRATGSHWSFTPNVDIARDARWGRVGETYGEDTYLVTEMGNATIRGLQGVDCSGELSVLACAKHLIAGSEPSNGTNAAPMDVSERTLREVYLPPYKSAIQDAGVFTLMAAHNELNGVPCHSDKWLMNDIMRHEYGFRGFIVSDWMDVDRVYSLHHAAPTLDDAFCQSVMAGIDMRMHGPELQQSLVKMVKEGKMPESRIDEACTKILNAKFRLGLFENPYVDLKKVDRTVFNEVHQASALQLAEESIVLLKNNKNTLPLDLSKVKNIFVTGPNANNQAILGDWALLQPDEKVTTILEGLQQVAGRNHVSYYDYGTNVRQNDPSKVIGATEMAKKADVAIVVVGENPLRYQKDKTCGENIDRQSLDLLGLQEQLIKSISATGVPTIVVLTGGRPLTVSHIEKDVPAIIQAWEPGSVGGLALANIVCGKVNPSGKLPVTMPYSVGQIQMIYNHKPSQYFHKYKDGPSTPLWHFGYGLSYTSFSISDITLSASQMTASQALKASVDVTNTGNIEGTEVVQLYIRDDYSSATRPVKELKAFKRVSLKAGEKTTITFDITPKMLAYYQLNMKYGVEPGTFTLMVGNSSRDKDLKTKKIKVTE